MAKYSILILTEDLYGKDFFRGLIERLKRGGYIKSRYKIEYEWLSGKCNTKTNRKLLAKAHYLERVIVVVDAEGGDKMEVKRLIDLHIPPNLKSRTRYIIFDYCIEEWICKGMGIRLTSHPIRCLKNYIRNLKDAQYDYEKNMLPTFVEKIDLERLTKDKQFKDFLNYIS